MSLRMQQYRYLLSVVVVVLISFRQHQQPQHQSWSMMRTIVVVNASSSSSSMTATRTATTAFVMHRIKTNQQCNKDTSVLLSLRQQQELGPLSLSLFGAKNRSIRPGMLDNRLQSIQERYRMYLFPNFNNSMLQNIPKLRLMKWYNSRVLVRFLFACTMWWNFALTKTTIATAASIVPTNAVVQSVTIMESTPQQQQQPPPSSSKVQLADGRAVATTTRTSDTDSYSNHHMEQQPPQRNGNSFHTSTSNDKRHRQQQQQQQQIQLITGSAVILTTTAVGVRKVSKRNSNNSNNLDDDDPTNSFNQSRGKGTNISILGDVKSWNTSTTAATAAAATSFVSLRNKIQDATKVVDRLHPTLTSTMENTNKKVSTKTWYNQQQNGIASRAQQQQQPKSSTEEMQLQVKYASIESLEERAFAILLDLGMIHNHNDNPSIMEDPFDGTSE
jgi:microcompartment protein CcmL/EutN